MVKEGKTPVLSAEEAREFLDGIDLSMLVGLRDRALLRVLVFSFARTTTSRGSAPSSGCTRRESGTMSRRRGSLATRWSSWSSFGILKGTLLDWVVM